jgi:hypothetical protein
LTGFVVVVLLVDFCLILVVIVDFFLVDALVKEKRQIHQISDNEQNEN